MGYYGSIFALNFTLLYAYLAYKLCVVGQRGKNFDNVECPDKGKNGRSILKGAGCDGIKSNWSNIPCDNEKAKQEDPCPPSGPQISANVMSTKKSTVSNKPQQSQVPCIPCPPPYNPSTQLDKPSPPPSKPCPPPCNPCPPCPPCPAICKPCPPCPPCPQISIPCPPPCPQLSIPCPPPCPQISKPCPPPCPPPPCIPCRPLIQPCTPCPPCPPPCIQCHPCPPPCIPCHPCPPCCIPCYPCPPPSTSHQTHAPPSKPCPPICPPPSQPSQPPSDQAHSGGSRPPLAIVTVDVEVDGMKQSIPCKPVEQAKSMIPVIKPCNKR